MKALVTGGSGFIGSFLVEALLKRKYEVVIFDTHEPVFTRDVLWIPGSITDRILVNNAVEGKDIVFHLAGILGTHETVKTAHEAARVNILGALNVLDASRVHKTRVIDISKPNYWRNSYTITKIAAEEFALMYRDEFGMDVRIVRWFNVYGPRQKTAREGYQKAVPTFILKALKNEPLPVFGDGTQGTDHIYVTDAVEAAIIIAESKKITETVEVGSGDEISVNELGELIIKLTGSASYIKHIPMRRGEREHTRIQANIHLLSSLGFSQKVGLQAGLEKTIAYYAALL